MTTGSRRGFKPPTEAAVERGEKALEHIKRTWPRLTRGYGLMPSEIARMPRWLLDVYLEELTRLEAREALEQVAVHAVPSMRKGDRERFMASLRKQAQVERRVEVAQSLEEYEANLAGMGIAVVKEPAPQA